MAKRPPFRRYFTDVLFCYRLLPIICINCVMECSNKRWKHFVFKKCCPKFVLKGNYCFYKKYTRGDKSRKRIHVLVVWHIAGGDVNNVDKMLLKWPYLSHLDLFICWRYSTCILLYVLFHYTIYAYDLKQAVTGNKTKHRWNIVEMAHFINVIYISSSDMSNHKDMYPFTRLISSRVHFVETVVSF
jgi:hypothetical protein